MTVKAPKIISVANQKGGVGKTTTTINLAAAFAEAGKKTLVLDLDPQGNASTGLGVALNQREINSYDVIIGTASADKAILETEYKNIKIIPATVDLSSADLELQKGAHRSTALKNAFKGEASPQLGDFDFILIDCPPSLSLLTVNALVASDSVLIPLQSEFFALEGLSQLMQTVREVRSVANPDLRFEGVVLTMYDARNNLSELVAQDARDNLADLVFETVIPRNVRVSEAPSFAMPVLSYDTKSKGSIAYRALAAEILEAQKQVTV